METPVSKQDIQNMIELQHKLIENAILAGADDTIIQTLKEGLNTLKGMLNGGKNGK